VDLKFEAVVIPVSDVDRAKKFYARLGWRLDADLSPGNGFRIVPFTPPGSGRSVRCGTRVTSSPPGSAPGLYSPARICPADGAETTVTPALYGVAMGAWRSVVTWV
jgi:catechol 2,3-dioxygenase-like lactoylglutathione lyase family enzyme